VRIAVGLVRQLAYLLSDGRRSHDRAQRGLALTRHGSRGNTDPHRASRSALGERGASCSPVRQSTTMTARSRTCGDPRERGASGDDLLNRRWVGWLLKPCCGAGARRGSPEASQRATPLGRIEQRHKVRASFRGFVAPTRSKDAGFACWAQLAKTTSIPTSPVGLFVLDLPKRSKCRPARLSQYGIRARCGLFRGIGTQARPKRSRVETQAEPEGPLSPLHPLVAAVERRERVESDACLIQASFTSPSRTRGLRCTCA
jgi:hypothetical protein